MPRAALHDGAMPIASRLVAAAALFVALALPNNATAQNGPAGKNSWLSVRGEVVSNYGLLAGPQLGSGLTVEWGQLQNQFFGVGTRIGVTRNDGTTSLLLLGGPQVHLALAENFVLMPSLTTGLKLSDAGFGFYIGGGLAALARFDTFYVGVEGELPIFVQGGQNSLFPGFYSVNLMGGLYF